MKLLFVYRDFLKEGGLPVDTRSFISNLPSDINVTVVCHENIELQSSLPFKFIIINSFEDIFFKPIEDNFDYCVFLGFSSLYNNFLALRIKIPYIILPFSQINRFLDYDNPFYQDILPEVRSLEQTSIIYPKRSRVKNGQRDLHSYLRKIKRTCFRKTLGYIYVRKALAIGVLSHYEKDEIHRIFKYNKFKFFNYRFGLNQESLKIGEDQFEKDTSKMKLVIWSRADFYYKGIDRILHVIKDLLKENHDLTFKLFIIGPDYNDGYSKIDDFINQNRLEEHIQLIKPGSYSPGTHALLMKSDLAVCLSRWDGPPRVIRESLELGVPILASKESNCDFLIENFDCGYLVNTQEELYHTLKFLDKNDVLTKRVNTEKFKTYFSWNECSSDFIKEISNL